jgi:hypothetical protein
MKRYLVSTLALLIFSACSQGNAPSNNLTAPSATSPSALTSLTSSSNARASVPLNFRAHLSGDDVVPPRDTLAQGEAIFQLSRDGRELSFRVIASNIENVLGAHIHLGAPGVNGPNLFFLLDPQNSPGGGRTDGVLATGTIVRGVAPLPPPLGANDAVRFDALIDLIEAGNVYIDVNTNDGVAPANTGPGDFPAGEIRGQLR